MLNRIRRTIREKGQGLTEYVLILAFIAGIGIMFSSGGLKGTLVNTITETSNILGSLFDEYVTASKNYSYYFTQYRSLSLDELTEKSSKERLKADQEGLALIASYFLGKTQDEVAYLMGVNNPNGFSNSFDSGGDWVKTNLNKDRMGPVNDDWSEVMVPLSYWNSNFDTDGYNWLECSKNVNLIQKMAGVDDLEAGKNRVSGHNNRAITQDRIFYSDGMIGSDSSNRAIAMQVHYNGDTVDQVRIVAHNGVLAMNKPQEQKGEFAGYDDSPGNSAINGGLNDKSKTVKGLDLTVTGTSDNYKYKVN